MDDEPGPARRLGDIGGDEGVALHPFDGHVDAGLAPGSRRVAGQGGDRPALGQQGRGDVSAERTGGAEDEGVARGRVRASKDMIGSCGPGWTPLLSVLAPDAKKLSIAVDALNENL